MAIEIVDLPTRVMADLSTSLRYIVSRQDIIGAGVVANDWAAVCGPLVAGETR